MITHEEYMKRCLDLGLQGITEVAPNPMVGSVIVHQGEIIGEGYHQFYGKAHAEVNAIASVKDKELLKNSTLYVNLEPCSHYGKTPPCADLIIKYKIPEVIIGSVDTNSLVAGQGIEKLENAGVKVKIGLLVKECRELNKRFFSHHEKKRPYVILKWAQTSDGFIDHKRTPEMNENALQISNSESRKLLHKWRSEEQAIIVGTNTTLLDNPKLTVREVKGKNPLRITIDKWLRIPKHFNIFDKSSATLIFTAGDGESELSLEYEKIDFNDSVVKQILQELYRRNIRSLLVEGGEQLLNSFIKEDFWDEARIFISEKKIGKGVAAPVMSLPPIKRENISGDLLISYRNSPNF